MTKKTKTSEIKGGPFVALAVLCERAIPEKDGVFTLIRIIDTYNLPFNEDAGPFTLPLTVMIGIRSGGAKGKMTLTLRGQTPNPKTIMPEMKMPVVFDGKGETGINLPIQLNLNLATAGLYAFDVLLNNKLMTRIPLRVNFQSQGAKKTKGK
jgi:hypothetical protein